MKIGECGRAGKGAAITGAERELIEAWRAVANAKLVEYRRQCWRLAGLVRQGLADKPAESIGCGKSQRHTRWSARSVRTA